MYSQETLRIAKALAANSQDRVELRRMLDNMEAPEPHSNARFDQIQALASALHSLILEAA